MTLGFLVLWYSTQVTRYLPSIMFAVILAAGMFAVEVGYAQFLVAVHAAVFKLIPLRFQTGHLRDMVPESPDVDQERTGQNRWHILAFRIMLLLYTILLPVVSMLIMFVPTLLIALSWIEQTVTSDGELVFFIICLVYEGSSSVTLILSVAFGNLFGDSFGICIEGGGDD